LAGFFQLASVLCDIFFTSKIGQFDQEDLIAGRSGTSVIVFVLLHCIVFTLLLTLMAIFMCLSGNGRERR